MHLGCKIFKGNEALWIQYQYLFQKTKICWPRYIACNPYNIVYYSINLHKYRLKADPIGTIFCTSSDSYTFMRENINKCT